jgi:hypothetical protein
MKTTLFVAVLFSCVAFAQGAPPAKAGAAPAPAKEEPKKDAAAAPAAGADMMATHGPWTRKVKDEKAVKKEIDEFFKKNEEAEKKGDMETMLSSINFPVWMATDDAKGELEAKAFTKDQYVAMMKPMMENMPKDMKTTHKSTVTVLSDALVQVSDDFTMTSGKNKMAGRNGGLIAKVGGQWKWQMMVEAGWGGMAPPAQADGKPSAGAPEKKDAAAAPAGSAAQKK